MKKCGIILCNIDTNAYLLVLGKKSGKWGFPKGHMEIGENEEMTAQREFFEETGIEMSKSYFQNRIRFRNNIYFCIYLPENQIPVPSQKEIPDSREIEKMQWFSETDIRNLDPESCNFGLKSWINMRHRNTRMTENMNLSFSIPQVVPVIHDYFT